LTPRRGRLAEGVDEDDVVAAGGDVGDGVEELSPSWGS
jgi:hypothetical protein